MKLEKYFKYHPPTTEERKTKHNKTNKAALRFAKEIENCVQDEELKKMAYYGVQQARMFANQGRTMDSLPDD